MKTKDWMTVKETVRLLGVGRKQVRVLADEYEWGKRKDGRLRMYLRVDVCATPNAKERHEKGREKRKQPQIKACSVCRETAVNWRLREGKRAWL